MVIIYGIYITEYLKYSPSTCITYSVHTVKQKYNTLVTQLLQYVSSVKMPLATTVNMDHIEFLVTMATYIFGYTLIMEFYNACETLK